LPSALLPGPFMARGDEVRPRLSSPASLQMDSRLRGNDLMLRGRSVVP